MYVIEGECFLSHNAVERVAQILGNPDAITWIISFEMMKSLCSVVDVATCATQDVYVVI